MLHTQCNIQNILLRLSISISGYNGNTYYYYLNRTNDSYDRIV